MLSLAYLAVAELLAQVALVSSIIFRMLQLIYFVISIEKQSFFDITSEMARKPN